MLRKRADNQIDYSKGGLTPQLYAVSKSPLLTLEDSAKMSIFEVGGHRKPTDYTCSYWDVESSFLTCNPSGHQQMQNKHKSYQTTLVNEHRRTFDILASSPGISRLQFHRQILGKNWEWDCFVRYLQVGKCIMLWNADAPYNSLTLAPQCTIFP